MTIDCIVSEHQYWNHLSPIWAALPDSQRGTLYISTMLAKRCADEGVEAVQRRAPVKSPNPTLVASYGDYHTSPQRTVIYVEHGSGQTYSGVESPAYSGGPGRDRTLLFICPNQTVADRNLLTYPHIPVAVVGCPALDRFHPPRPPLSPSTIAITFHSDIRLVPESASSFQEFHTALPILRDAGFEVLGHAHPRIYRRLKPFYDAAGIRSTPHLSVVMEEAGVMAGDNTSAMFEFASLSRPVVWMSPSFYRRDVIAWPRFWHALVLGEDTTSPEQLPAAVTRALEPVSDEVHATREAFLDTLYPARDGGATSRAIQAIMEVL